MTIQKNAVYNISKYFWLFFIFFSCITLQAQNDTIRLSEVKVFSANKFEENIRDLNYKVEIITEKDINFRMPQTSGELLAQTGAVFMQTSQLGGGSPVIRGFEANRVLLVVDGVRLNNTIYRNGHLQNVITIDPNMLERVEILYGPGSVIYGSDALGGVMAFFTKRPTLATGDQKVFVSGSMQAQFQSATLSPSGSFTFNFARQKFAWLMSYSGRKINDLRVGRNMNPLYGDWGLANYYAERINDKDSTIRNSKPWIMKNSGYEQYDLLQKFLYKPSKNVSLQLNLQGSTSGDIPRYDRMLSMIGDNMEYAEFYYGPQNRFFGYFTAEVTNQKHFDDMRITLGGQYIDESRMQRRFNNNDKRYQKEAVGVGCLNADWQKSVGKNKNFELRWGIEAVYNNVTSKAYNENILTEKITYNAVTRYPDSLNHVFNTSAYLTHSWEINEQWIFRQGFRVTYQYLHSVYTDSVMRLTKFPFDNTILNQTAAPTGFLGVIFMPKHHWRLVLNLATGFKSPNVDDTGKVNDSKANMRQLIIPNPDLQPEYVYNMDLSIEKTFFNRLNFGILGFFTLNQNVVSVGRTTLNGQDSVMFDGKMCDVYSLQNFGLGYITGIQGFMNLQITKFFNINGNIAYTYGRILDEARTPLSHVPPLYGIISFVFKHKGFTGDFYVRYNGWKHAKDINIDGEDNYTMGMPLENGEYAGFPAWFTLNLKLAYQFNKHLSIHAGIENLLDTYYRLNASGISAPGINGMMGVRCCF
ncbi:MAG: TonB-dependent receptor [Lentimicrobiaceae bacterium]|nr:TonB-dependent receptor [Lentimicrobiaceae bacterium]